MPAHARSEPLLHAGSGTKMTTQDMQTMVLNEQMFQYAEIALGVLMAIWAFVLWRNYSLLQSMLFRIVPFVLVIALFSIAFYSERFH